MSVCYTAVLQSLVEVAAAAAAASCPALQLIPGICAAMQDNTPRSQALGNIPMNENTW